MSDIRKRLDDRTISKSELFEVADEIEELIGYRELLDNIQLGLDVDALRDILVYIARNFDL